MLNMKTHLITLITVLLLAAVVVSEEKPATPNEYSKAMADYFVVSQDSISLLVNAGLPDEELAVALYIAAEGKGSPVQLAKLRAKGDSWNEIVATRAMRTDLFYIMVGVPVTSTTYKPLFDKFSSTPEQKWRSITWTNKELINLVNLRFISSHYDYSMFTIMEMRDKGQSFLRICEIVSNAKIEMAKEEKLKQAERSKKEKEKIKEEQEGE